jgi:hypothetical protein
MKNPNPQQSYPDMGLSPFQEIRLLFTCAGPALRTIKWRPVLVSVSLSFLSSLVVLFAAYRLLDGSWEAIKVLPKAVIISALIGLNLTFQRMIPYMKERIMIETEKAKRDSKKNIQRK